MKAGPLTRSEIDWKRARDLWEIQMRGSLGSKIFLFIAGEDLEPNSGFARTFKALDKISANLGDISRSYIFEDPEGSPKLQAVPVTI